jgi:hypothetical protein
MKIAGQDVANASELADWILRAAAAGEGEIPPDPGPAAALNRAWRDGGDAAWQLIADAAVEAARRGDERVRAEVLIVAEGKSHDTIRDALVEWAEADWVDDPNPLRGDEPLGRALTARLSHWAQGDAEARDAMNALALRVGAEDVVLGFHLLHDPAGAGLAALKAMAASKRPISPGMAQNLGLAFTLSAPDAAPDAAKCLAGYDSEVREAFWREAQSNLDGAAKDAVRRALGLS